MLINIVHLREWLGVHHTKKVIAFLREKQIPFELHNGQPITTEAAINSRLMGGDTEKEEVKF